MEKDVIFFEDSIKSLNILRKFALMAHKKYARTNA